MIKVSKEILINTGKFENIKIIAAIESNDDNFEVAWKDLNEQIRIQETIERNTRLGGSTEPSGEWKNTRDAEPMPF